ncbi:putative P6 protein [Peach associated luteovirus]|uniref:putative P6 protein n=1 Tax=Peach associated luteovirus TaxID=2006498 RepID=UPI000B423F4C|nr:putative P6 protein [Peach associated luteovirus]ARV85987.1 putative P6 protein [Peach associated luteovirus]
MTMRLIPLPRALPPIVVCLVVDSLVRKRGEDRCQVVKVVKTTRWILGNRQSWIILA